MHTNQWLSVYALPDCSLSAVGVYRQDRYCSGLGTFLLKRLKVIIAKII